MSPIHDTSVLELRSIHAQRRVDAIFIADFPRILAAFEVSLLQSTLI
jgi:hypothetical protein